MQENIRQNSFEDEIDFKELFITIWEKRFFIIVVTFLVTLASVVYVLLKNSAPIYEGKLYLEIGKIQDKNFTPVPIETPADTSNIINIVFASKETKSQLLKGSTKVLEVSSSNSNKDTIKKELEKVKEFVLAKHKEDAKLYENVLMTRQVGSIAISDEPINTPKSLIITVAFITGFIFSIFLLFFMQFIEELKGKK